MFWVSNNFHAYHETWNMNTQILNLKLFRKRQLRDHDDVDDDDNNDNNNGYDHSVAEKHDNYIDDNDEDDDNNMMTESSCWVWLT